MNSSNGSTLLIATSVIVGIPVLFGWLALIVQCANAEFKTDGDKVAWTLILLFLGPLGALLYLVGGRTRQDASRAKDKWVV
ncbi:MAG: PLDc N-terminal domain-containing protein [Holophagaceae bacterium]|nr:PLDc N-terminal domain-containing protein [Holophagaceae bacterium]